MANELTGVGSTSFVKVMTDEQMEVLREQIAVYATICEQLVEMHKSITAQNDLAGSRLGNLYCDPLITSNSGHKLTGRQRWSPTPQQLQILERIFNQGINNPGKLKVPEITAELLQHGQVTETNVYNWFQNRRARSKRKQQSTTVDNNAAAESELETDRDEFSNDNKKKTEEDFQPTTNVCSSRANEDAGFQKAQTGPGVQYDMDPSFGEPEDALFYGNMMQNPGMDHLIGKMEVPGNYGSYLQQDDYI